MVTPHARSGSSTYANAAGVRVGAGVRPGEGGRAAGVLPRVMCGAGDCRVACGC